MYVDVASSKLHTPIGLCSRRGALPAGHDPQHNHVNIGVLALARKSVQDDATSACNTSGHILCLAPRYMRQLTEEEIQRLYHVQVTEDLMEHAHECFHLPDVEGSDHCPVGIVLRKDNLQESVEAAPAS